MQKVDWKVVAVAAGLALVLVAALLGTVALRKGPPPQAIATASTHTLRSPAAPQPAIPPVEDAPCDVHVATTAMLRERGTGAQTMGRAIRILEILNGLPEGGIAILGWAAEESDAGPPCYATFTYEQRGVRETARFKFWPRQPARLATANAVASDLTDALEVAGIGGVTTTQTQATVATMLRLAGGFNNEDVYMSPRTEGELLVRRQHCVSENVDLSTPAARSLVRIMRRARITRYRCVADNPWTTDITPRGRIAPPYLLPQN